MKNYLEIIENSLKEKYSIPNTDNLKFRDIPASGEVRCNCTRVGGNRNLRAGRVKTKEEAEKVIVKYLNTKLP